MSEVRHVLAAQPDWSEPRVAKICLTHRNIHFLKAPSETALQASVIVGLTHRNHPGGLEEALKGAMAQDVANELAFLVLDDSSDEGWMQSLDIKLLTDPRLVVAAGRFGSPPQARNGLLDLVDQCLPHAKWVARMDADDRFASVGSLRALVQAGDACDRLFVIGSNRLSAGGEVLPAVNWAKAEILLDRGRLNAFIQAFCRQQVPNELPSCNLLLRARSGIRYPNAASAEDHWLVAGLLMHRPQDGCVVTEPVYAVYALGGAVTQANQKSDAWARSRLALAQAVEVWHGAQMVPGATVLGWGQEGVVWFEPTGIFKRFYPYALTADGLTQIRRLVAAAGDAVIAFDVCDDASQGPLIRLASEPLLEPGQRWPLALSRHFLHRLYRAGVVTSNVKRDNLRITASGELQYIDIGRDIVRLTASRFLDCAARLYAIGELGWSDHELVRRKSTERQVEALDALAGFDAFYGELIRSLHPACLLDIAAAVPLSEPSTHPDVTLLIKCCPQDTGSARLQVQHLVSELGMRARFAKKVLLIDPFEGPYLRQFAEGDLSMLRVAASQLHQAGLIDEVWVAPSDPVEVSEINQQWFAAPQISASHTAHGAPVASQLWAFDRVVTPFVLQMDIDVLIGGTDVHHDVIADMKRACIEQGVWCVGFNIPQVAEGFKAYAGEPDQYAPEVRCGLLNLERIKSHRPFANPLSGPQLSWMWHQALRQAQPEKGMRSVRGGDSRTFYIHPRNDDKSHVALDAVRDLVGQGQIPVCQRGEWDLVVSAEWDYPRRSEDMVFLLFGRETPAAKLERCLASLRAQSCQDFGVIVIDDGGCPLRAAELPHRIGSLSDRVTLIRRPKRLGYMENFRESVERICENPDALLVVLDQDDALMHVDAVQMLMHAWRSGADLINAPMFRPDKPLTLYEVSHESPRERGGGNVWAHLRAFRKSLFERVPEEVWDTAPDPDCLSDFLTMVPMAELAHKPVYLDGTYLYWHERMPYTAERKERERAMKAWLFSQPSLAQGLFG
jgi:hypothetical protein